MTYQATGLIAASTPEERVKRLVVFWEDEAEKLKLRSAAEGEFKDRASQAIADNMSRDAKQIMKCASEIRATLSWPRPGPSATQAEDQK